MNCQLVLKTNYRNKIRDKFRSALEPRGNCYMLYAQLVRASPVTSGEQTGSYYHHK